MIEINLLPWRAEHQKRQKRERVLGIIITFLLSGMSWILLSFTTNIYLAHLTQSENLLQKKLDQSEQMSRPIAIFKQHYEHLLSIGAAWDTFRFKQQKAIERLNELVSLSQLPVRFKEIDISQKEMEMKGETEAMQSLQQLINQLHQSLFYKTLQLKAVTRSVDDGIIHFTLRKEEDPVDHQAV